MKIYYSEKFARGIGETFTPMKLCEDTILHLMKENMPPEILQAELTFLMGQLLNVHKDNPLLEPGEIVYRYDKIKWTKRKELSDWLFQSAIRANVLLYSKDIGGPGYLDPDDVPYAYFPSDERFEEWYSNARYRYEGLFVFNQNNRDVKEGLDKFRKSEDVFCWRKLAIFYYNGEVTQRNQEEGIYWQKKAAELCGGEDERTLAYMYYNAENDYKKEAFKIFKEHADRVPFTGLEKFGTKWVYSSGDKAAQGMYGYMLLLGIGTQADHDEGLKWLRIAAERGDKFALDVFEEYKIPL